jgi:hypothetical protein
MMRSGERARLARWQRRLAFANFSMSPFPYFSLGAAVTGWRPLLVKFTGRCSVYPPRRGEGFRSVTPLFRSGERARLACWQRPRGQRASFNVAGASLQLPHEAINELNAIAG